MAAHDGERCPLLGVICERDCDRSWACRAAMEYLNWLADTPAPFGITAATARGWSRPPGNALG